MKKSLNLKIELVFIKIFLFFSVGYAQVDHFPPRQGSWETRDPEEMGFDKDLLDEAIAFAESNEYDGSRDLRIAILEAFAWEPFHEIVGPTKKRGGSAGIILKKGYMVATWGDIRRVDMTFSVTKSYLSTVAGLAWQEGLIGDLQDPVYTYVWDGTFTGEHNRKISWHHLLNQSSDWSGSLFGMHDWADRPPSEGDIDDWRNRELYAPGTHYKYNDVRVNVLAYSLLQVWRKPLPMVLKEKIMDPIGASTTWRWYGYDNSWVDVDGLKIQSVSGGGHSGGGMFISTEDHARFGLLFLNLGKWNDRQLIAEEWIREMVKPSEANPSYGYMWWLNRGPDQWENLPDSIYYAAGFGGNYIVVIPSEEMVVVTRWLAPGKLGDFLSLVMNAEK
jgi:CubicO group peptidase (beta-lactamase class C family)